MMAMVFWVVTVAFLSAVLLRVLHTRDYFAIYNYIAVGVYLPLILYLEGWSDYVALPPTDAFYLLFVQLGIVLLFFMIIEPKSGLSLPVPSVKSARHGWIFLVTAAYLAACLVENYLGSGSLLPSLAGIDIHTYRAPLLAYFTKAIYAVVLVNYLGAQAARTMRLKLFHVASIVLIVALYLGGKSSRMEVAILFVQLLSVALLLGRRVGFVNRPTIKSVAFAVAGLVVALYAFVQVGNHRSSQYGAYEVETYGEAIAYTGPSLFGGLLEWYYGYFPMSFNNLNLAILNVGELGDLRGTNVFKMIYFGMFQMDNLLGWEAYRAEDLVPYLIPQAMVATGFWNIYFDFGSLAIAIYILAMMVYRWIRSPLESGNSGLARYAIYMYWVPTWLFMSFQPFPFDVFVASDLVWTYLLVTWLVRVRRRGVECLSEGWEVAYCPDEQRLIRPPGSQIRAPSLTGVPPT